LFVVSSTTSVVVPYEISAKKGKYFEESMSKIRYVISHPQFSFIFILLPFLSYLKFNDHGQPTIEKYYNKI